jgi:hypothetical protein
MKAIQMTYELAMALSRDAGNRSMRKANRTKWNEQDWTSPLTLSTRLLGWLRELGVLLEVRADNKL